MGKNARKASRRKISEAERRRLRKAPPAYDEGYRPKRGANWYDEIQGESNTRRGK